MDVRRGKEGKTEGAEAGIARRVEEERRRKVRKLTAGGQMESARWGLSKVCMVSNWEYNGVWVDGDGRPARHRSPLFQW